MAPLAALALVLTAVAACASLDRPPPLPVAECVSDRIAPGDQLRLVRHPLGSGRDSDLLEFATTHEVDEHGVVHIPGFGEFVAAGKTTRQLQRDLEFRRVREGGIMLLPYQLYPSFDEDLWGEPPFRVELVRGPFVIIGEVNHPGRFAHFETEELTVIGAVALAGGYTHRAEQNYVIVHRDGREYSAEASDLVCRGDVISVPERFF